MRRTFWITEWTQFNHCIRVRAIRAFTLRGALKQAGRTKLNPANNIEAMPS